jgi:hypothetical protein
VVQAEASVLCSRFGLFASPTNNILEQTATGICPFADIDVICLRTPGPVAQIMLKLASPRRYEKSKDVTFKFQALLVSAGVARKGRLSLNVGRISNRANNRNLSILEHSGIGLLETSRVAEQPKCGQFLMAGPRFGGVSNRTVTRGQVLQDSLPAHVLEEVVPDVD